jgi:hypothetical protein
MSRRRFLALGAVMAAGAALGAVSPAALAGSSIALPAVEVFKSPYCGCCAAWVTHMERAGFTVKVTPVEDVGAARARLGMPANLASCHTATVGGYVLEGHVPAREVKLLLERKSPALGLAVPGMPAGSPGMEAGPRQDAYQVLLVARDGKTAPFAAYPRK